MTKGKKVDDLTPAEAVRLFEEEDMSNGDIAEKYDCSPDTVRRRRKTHAEIEETAEEVAQDKIESVDFTDAVDDDEPDENPYDTVKCPGCGYHIDSPEEPTTVECDGCGSQVKILESDL